MTRRTELLPGVFLTAVQDRRFKTACFSLSFLRPLRQEEAGMKRWICLLLCLLLTGCSLCLFLFLSFKSASFSECPLFPASGTSLFQPVNTFAAFF